MLILSRRPGETVVIGDDITATVIGVKGNQVRIGFVAPKEISVHRKEIYMRIGETQDSSEEPLANQGEILAHAILATSVALNKRFADMPETIDSARVLAKIALVAEQIITDTCSDGHSLEDGVHKAAQAIRAIADGEGVDAALKGLSTAA